MKDMETVDCTIIKADPGWYIVYYLEDEQLHPTPIIAWAVKNIRLSTNVPGKDPKYFYDPQPLTPEGEPDLGYTAPWCIKTPDNHFIFLQDTILYREKDAIARFKELGHFQTKEK